MKKKFKWKKLIIILAIVVAVILAAVLFLKKKLDDVANVLTPVQLQEVRKQDLSDFISLTGTISGEAKTNYSSSAAAKFATINVQVGDEVKEGDVIATLDTESIQSQINTIEKSISNAAALRENQSKLNQRNLDSAKTEQNNRLNQANQAISSADAQYAAIENTINDLSAQAASLTEQMNTLEDEQAKAKLSAQIDQINVSLEEARAELGAADSARNEARANYDSVKSATDEAIFSAQNTIDMEKYSVEDDSATQTQLEDLRRQLEDCTITSTSAGIVTAVNVAVGDMNTPNAAVVTVENNQSMVMTANVPETDILKLQEGMKAVITADALEEQEVEGEVIKVVKVYNSSAAPAASGEEMAASVPTGGFSVQIRLEDSPLISGMNAKAKIIITDKTNVLCVPYDLVMEDESGQSYILCAEDNGDGTWTAVRKNIKVGEEVNYYVEVTGGDVKEGDYVVMDYEMQEGEVFHAEISMDEEEDSSTGVSVNVGG